MYIYTYIYIYMRIYDVVYIYTVYDTWVCPRIWMTTCSHTTLNSC